VIEDTGKFVGHRGDCGWGGGVLFILRSNLRRKFGSGTSLCGESQSESGANLLGR